MLYAARSDPDEVYLDAAGVVLLWPFITTFFNRVGLLVDGKAFVDVSAQHRAVLLVQHLATGDVDPPEFHLPMAKMLCGLGLDELFERPLDLTETEMDEATTLLSSVVVHAKHLGNLTPEAFRNAYLRRRGVLSVRDGTWLLRVERAPYDILLQRLPWTMQWVRLPWMVAPLFVEWIE